MSPARASIVSRPGTRYPAPGAAYSPSESYPEYQFDQVAVRPNAVYSMVRETLAQIGLDAEHFGSPSWNPLGNFVAPGSRVFVLCNLVYHRRPNEATRDFQAKCVHGSVVRALIDYLLLATGTEGRIVVGSAPLQSCDWDSVMNGTGLTEVLGFYRDAHMPVESKDLRLFVTRMTPAGRLHAVNHQATAGDSIDIDLGLESLLAGITSQQSGGSHFRISDYNPDRLESFHQGTSHHYQVHRLIVESDVVLSLSTLKTHEKVGVTCGIKGFVGTVTYKDCLAHHRQGTPATGGDELPTSLRFLTPVSRFSDWVYRHDPMYPLLPVLQVADRSVKRVLRRLGVRLAGSWSGNDTAWRMAIDLARIAYYADRTGKMNDGPQRVHLSFIDGIVGGEKDGPLAPDAVDSGTVLFTDDVVLGDRLACRLMGYDPERLPIAREAAKSFRYPIASNSRDRPTIWYNGAKRFEGEVTSALGRQFVAPRGWRHHLAPSRDDRASADRPATSLLQAGTNATSLPS